MIVAHHAIFGAYGFWLPNDPRGSWSDFVASWELFRYGKTTKTNSRRSRAHMGHDETRRLVAKKALKYPPVSFNGIQARAVARGFAIACQKSRYYVGACSIMPEHVHMVVGVHDQMIERIVGHFKSQATQQLISENLHPLQEFCTPRHPPLTPWEEGCWKVFISTEGELQHAIHYVNNNPIKEGKKPQHWSFVK